MSHVAVVGTGAIGASWAALFAAHGYDVIASDPSLGAQASLADEVARCWDSLTRQGLIRDGAAANVTMAASVTEAVEGASFVQENAPERLDLKLDLYRTMDAAASATTVIASSSSGITPSTLQQGCPRHPGRVVVGHPFNPPHIVPLVEVVGGELTTDDTIATALEFYRSCSRTPIHIHVELPGHVTNRLQAALWREAYWLVEQGVVSVADIDTAIASGPGLRWAFHGPFATQHLSGGGGGIAHVLEHLGPPMVEWWESFEMPALGPGLIDRVISGVDAELDGRDLESVRADRDRLLERLMLLKNEGTNQSDRNSP